MDIGWRGESVWTLSEKVVPKWKLKRAHGRRLKMLSRKEHYQVNTHHVSSYLALYCGSVVLCHGVLLFMSKSGSYSPGVVLHVWYKIRHKQDSLVT